jgi:tetratricopeptide (TPR) repeat protein
MISSTARDLPEHRQKVVDACMRLGMFYPDMMEHLTASDADALEVSLAIADRADLYVGIFAFRYGYVPDGETISVTESEYNRAVDRKIPRLLFLISDKHPVFGGDVETGDGAQKLTALKERLQKERVVAFFDSASDLETKVLQALLPYRDTTDSASKNAAAPLIHSLPTQQEIEGREVECASILRAMSAGDHQVYVFTAPGGFGKTALLAKVVKALSPDDATLLETIKFAEGTIDPQVAALLHVDCRKDVKLSELFSNAGRLIGAEQTFDTIYNAEGELPDKLQEIFRRLSADKQDRVWFVFDNFESMLNDKSEVADLNLRAFFSAIFAGGHRVRALIVGRDVPKFSRRENPEVLETIGARLFDGLPIDDCLEFLAKNDGARGLAGSPDEIKSVLRQFASRVHRIPLALVWAVGYLHDTSFTLREILNRPDLFADFDKEQGKDADSYENKGVKRLHYEQLKIQPAAFLPVLQLLAFFKRPVPRAVLAHLMDEIELSKTLTRLERNRLITHKESPDAHTRFINDPLAVNLYGLHPVICENEFFETLPDQERLFETAAGKCWTMAHAAVKVNRFAHLFEVAACGEELYEHLIKGFARDDLRNDYAGMLNSKGLALSSLTKLNEALAEYDKAITIYQLVNEERQIDLSNDLARTYMNKGNALWRLAKLNEALMEYDKAIAIRERLVNEEQQTHLAKGLATAYMNKGLALRGLKKLDEALLEYDKAIAIRERLVNEEQQTHLASNLAMAYVNKGVALRKLTKLNAALVEYDKAITIYERLVNEEQQTHLADGL